MPSINSPTPDATTTFKGKLQLAGDLAGTASSPTVQKMTVARQNDAANTTVPGSRIETGWGVFTAPVVNDRFTEDVTFGTAFTVAPIVTITFGGDQTSGTVAYGNGGNNVIGKASAKVYGVTTTKFTAYVYGDTSWSAGNNIYYQWIAIGV